MLAMKSAAAALLAVLVLAVITPSILHQDAGPGKPDDVAQLLPEETLAFVELVKAPKLLGDWKEYVGSLTTAEGKDKTCAIISDYFEKALEIVPEKILKDLKEGLPSIQRMAVALTGAPDPELPWILVATSSDPAFFKKLVENDLSVFASEEKAHNGVKIFAIRKMGEMKSKDPFFVAAAGSRLLVTTRWASMTDALDRAAGRGTGGDLRKNRLYAQLAPAASDDPALRAFSRWDWDLIPDMFDSSGAYDRMSRYHMDMFDAVFGFRRIVGTVVETTFKPGRVVSTLRLPVNSPCRLYDALRQPPGPKDLLAHLPPKTVLYVHANLKEGKEIWADVEKLVRRFQEAERKAEPHSDPKDYLADFDRHMKGDLGVAPRDIAAITGDEVLFALVRTEKPEPSFLLLLRTADPAKARELLETSAKSKGKYAGTTEDKMTLYRRTKPDRSCFGIQDSVIAFGDAEAVVKEALKSKGDACGALKRLPKEAASASMVAAFNTARLVNLLAGLSGEETPEFLKHLRPDDWSDQLCRTEKDQALMTMTDGGPGAIAQSALSMAPLLMAAGFGFMMMGPMLDMPEAAPAEPAKPVAEPKALPADELAKRTAELIPLLRSDDLTVREKASGDLRALGRQAIPLLVAAYRAEKDAEARSRLTNLLVDHKAWDALPDLMDRRVDMFFGEFRKAVEETLSNDRSAYAHWNDPESDEPWSMEPYHSSAFTKALVNGEIADIPAALRKVAERLLKSDLPAPLRSQFAALLAFNDCGPAHEAVLQLRDASTDAESKAFFTVALGWSDDAKAKEAVYASLDSKDRAIRRGAFMALDRARDPAAVTRLLDRTKEGDFESRWNAGYTAGHITSGKLELNAFLPGDEFDAQLKTARTWWDQNKDGFKLRALTSKPK